MLPMGSSMADYSKAIKNFKNLIKLIQNLLTYLMLAKVYRETDRQKEYDLLKLIKFS